MLHVQKVFRHIQIEVFWRVRLSSDRRAYFITGGRLTLHWEQQRRCSMLKHLLILKIWLRLDQLRHACVCVCVYVCVWYPNWINFFNGAVSLIEYNKVIIRNVLEQCVHVCVHSIPLLLSKFCLGGVFTRLMGWLCAPTLPSSSWWPSSTDSARKSLRELWVHFVLNTPAELGTENRTNYKTNKRIQSLQQMDT